jgi:hypothetical protein
MEEISKIVTELNDVIKKEEAKQHGTKNNDSLLVANDYYNKLIENGMVKKRGFTLRGIEDTHLFNVRLNNY